MCKEGLLRSKLSIDDFTTNHETLTSSANGEIVISGKCQHLCTNLSGASVSSTKYFSFLVLFSELSCCVLVRSTSGLGCCCCLCCFYFFLLCQRNTMCTLMLVRFYDDYFPHLTFLLLRPRIQIKSMKKGQQKTKTEDLEISWFNLESPTT